jgi:hypothetical protein
VSNLQYVQANRHRVVAYPATAAPISSRSAKLRSDSLFASAACRPGKPTGYGLAEPFPAGFLAQQAHAFHRML